MVMTFFQTDIVLKNCISHNLSKLSCLCCLFRPLSLLCTAERFYLRSCRWPYYVYLSCRINAKDEVKSQASWCCIIFLLLCLKIWNKMIHYLFVACKDDQIFMAILGNISPLPCAEIQFSFFFLLKCMGEKLCGRGPIPFDEKNGCFNTFLKVYL